MCLIRCHYMRWCIACMPIVRLIIVIFYFPVRNDGLVNATTCIVSRRRSAMRSP